MSADIRIVDWRRRWRGAGVFAGLFVYSLFAVGPILWIVLMSFKQGADIIAYPPKFVDFAPTLDNYRAIFALPDFLNPFWNTLRITLPSGSP